MGLTFTAPAQLLFEHNLDEFHSGIAALDEWLKGLALQAAASGTARTFVVLGEANRVIAYYSLATGSVSPANATARVSRGTGRHDIPVVLLARLAVDVEFQGQGLGVGLLLDALRRVIGVSTEIGVRAILVHPINELAESFYREFGFEASPVDDRQMMLILKDAKKLIAG